MDPVMKAALQRDKVTIDPSLRLYIPFNEGVGSIAKDYSQYGNNGVLTDVEWGLKGGVFNGTSAYVDCGNDSSLDLTEAITIEAWVKQKETSRVAFSKGSHGVDGWYVDFLTAGRVLFKYSKVGTADEIISSANTIQNNVWIHMVIVVDNGNTVAFYFNGNFDRSEAMDFSYLGNINRYSIIGVYSLGYLIPFDGAIDGVKIYNRELGALEILNTYESERGRYEV